MADSVALMRSSAGICSEATAKFSHFGRDIPLWLGQLSVGQVFHALPLYVQMCCDVDVLVFPGESFCFMQVALTCLYRDDKVSRFTMTWMSERFLHRLIPFTERPNQWMDLNCVDVDQSAVSDLKSVALELNVFV